MRCCPKQNKVEKHHSTSRAGAAMIPKERKNVIVSIVD